MARVRASAAALSLALLFILLTPNPNYGGRAAAVDADDWPLRAQRCGTPPPRRHRGVGLIRRRARGRNAAGDPHPQAPTEIGRASGWERGMKSGSIPGVGSPI